MSIITPPSVRSIDSSLRGMHFLVMSTNPQKNQEIFAQAHLTLEEMKKKTYLNFFVGREDPLLEITGNPHPGREMITEENGGTCGMTIWIGSASQEQGHKKDFSERRRTVEKVDVNLEFLEDPELESEVINGSLVGEITNLCENVFPHIKKAGAVNSSQVLTGEFFDRETVEEEKDKG